MEKQHGPWTILETTRVFENEFMEVLSDEVVQPDGERGTYATVKMKPGVSVLVVDDENCVYLTRQFRYAVGRETTEVVSGGREAWETPLAAARREVKEELGIEAEEWLELGSVDADTSIVNSASEQFLARGLKFSEPEREGTEQLRTVRASLDAAVRMVLDGHITHAPSCTLILKADRYLRGPENSHQLESV